MPHSYFAMNLSTAIIKQQITSHTHIYQFRFALPLSTIFENHHHHPFSLYNYIFPKGKLDLSGVLTLCHIKDFTAAAPTEVSVLLWRIHELRTLPLIGISAQWYRYDRHWGCAATCAPITTAECVNRYVQIKQGWDQTESRIKKGYPFISAHRTGKHKIRRWCELLIFCFCTSGLKSLIRAVCSCHTCYLGDTAKHSHNVNNFSKTNS